MSKFRGEYAFSKVPWPYADMQPMVEDVYRAYGRGSHDVGVPDSPWIVVEPGYQKLVDLLDYHLPDISAAEKEMIMGGTALKLWFRGRSSVASRPSQVCSYAPADKASKKADAPRRPCS